MSLALLLGQLGGGGGGAVSVPPPISVAASGQGAPFPRGFYLERGTTPSYRPREPGRPSFYQQLFARSIAAAAANR
jgi:hypothetical protein